MPSLIHSRGLSLHPLVPFLALALERRQWQTNRLDLSLIAAPRINIEWADSTRLLPVLELSPSALPAFSVGPLPTVAYVPDYLTAGEEASLLREIRSTQRWTEVSGRRLQTHGGTVHEKKGLLQTQLPAWLARLASRLATDTAAYGVNNKDGRPLEPNHVLINAYTAEQGIMAHQDGPAYWPGVCIVSLGATAVMRFRGKATGEGAAAANTADLMPPGGAKPGDVVTSVVLQPRSLLFFSNEAYTSHLHGIDQVPLDIIDDTVCNAHACSLRHGDKLMREGERVSLTVRRVERVMPRLLRL